MEGGFDKFLASDNLIIFIGADPGSVHAVDAKTSAVLWTTHLGGSIISNITVTETGVFVVTNSAATEHASPHSSLLRSLSKKTGITNWSTGLPFSRETLLGTTQSKIIAAGRDGAVTALDGATGNVNWKLLLSGQITAGPYFFADSITLGTDRKEIISISTDSGIEINRLATKFIPTVIAGESANILVTGDDRGNVALLNTLTGRNIWRFKSGGAISAITISSSGVVVASLDNFIYMISMKSGDVLWKRRLPGRIPQGALVTDNYIFALIYGENSAFLIDTKKGKLIDQKSQTEKNYHSQAPLLVNNSDIIFATAGGIESHSVNGCSTK